MNEEQFYLESQEIIRKEILEKTGVDINKEVKKAISWAEEENKRQGYKDITDLKPGEVINILNRMHKND